MPEIRTLEQALADWRERANTLRTCRRPADAELVDEIVGDFAIAAEEFTRWISEDDARMRSGRGLAYFRGRFQDWQEQGHARFGRDGRREYRLVVVPQRAHLSAAREAGLEAGRRAARRTAGGSR